MAGKTVADGKLLRAVDAGLDMGQVLILATSVIAQSLEFGNERKSQ
jgi:hypothetical protein